MTQTRTIVEREAARAERRLEVHVGESIRTLRLDAGGSLKALGRATGLDPAYLGRIEAGSAHPSLEALTRIGLALGCDLSVRFFPASRPRIVDRFQAPMVEALLRELHGTWRPELEVPVNVGPVRGFIDAVFTGSTRSTVVPTEVHSDLLRVEQLLRRGREKAESLSIPDGWRRSQLLVLRSTLRTREVARQLEATLAAAFPARTSQAVASLTSGDVPWPGAAIVWMHLHGTAATLMRHPPPGVRLGR